MSSSSSTDSRSAAAIRILLADDHDVIRREIRTLLETRPGLSVIGEAHDGHEAVRLAALLAPDLILMDVTMPGLGGIDATRTILGNSPRIKVIALTMHEDGDFVRGMLEAGASGYALKDGASTELTVAIDEVLAGRVYVFPGCRA